MNRLLLLILAGQKIFKMCDTNKKSSRIKKAKSVRKKMALDCFGEKDINTSMQPDVFNI